MCGTSQSAGSKITGSRNNTVGNSNRKKPMSCAVLSQQQVHGPWLHKHLLYHSSMTLAAEGNRVSAWCCIPTEIPHKYAECAAPRASKHSPHNVTASSLQAYCQTEYACSITQCVCYRACTVLTCSPQICLPCTWGCCRVQLAVSACPPCPDLPTQQQQRLRPGQLGCQTHHDQHQRQPVSCP